MTRSDVPRSDVAEPAEPPTPPKAYPENVLLHPAAHRAPAGSAPVAHLQELDTLALRPTATEGSLAVVLEPVMPSARQQPMVTVAAVRETVTYTLPVSEAALPQSLFKSATAKRSVLIEANVQDLAAAVGDVAAPRIALPSPLPPPLPAAIPVAISAALQPNVISLPEAAAEQVARHERTAWEIANNAGFESDQSHTLDPSSTDSDDLRTMALRLRPEKRDG